MYNFYFLNSYISVLPNLPRLNKKTSHIKTFQELSLHQVITTYIYKTYLSIKSVKERDEIGKEVGIGEGNS